MNKNNIYTHLPDDLSSEVIETLLQNKTLRIERIISHGHASAADFWYQQDENEWLIVLQGSAIIRFEDHSIELKSGDYLHIEALTKHRVESTENHSNTLWLAIFYT